MLDEFIAQSRILSKALVHNVLRREYINRSERSTWVSVAVNVVLSTAQIVVGVLAKSQGLIADGKHYPSDLVSDFVVLLANHASQKDADEDHAYGHHRYETSASLALGVILLTVGVGMLWSVAVKLKNPAAIAQVHVVALYVTLGRWWRRSYCSATC